VGAVSTSWGNARLNRYYNGLSKTTSVLVAFDAAFVAKPYPFLSLRPYLHDELLPDGALRRSTGNANLFVVGFATAVAF
jgi:hypothetical protein